jgi:hypothetical protein
MAEFTVTPADYLPGGRLFNNPNIATIEPQGVEPVTDKTTGVTYVPGTRAIEVTQTGQGYENLPQEVKAVVGGGGIGYNPYATAQGYAFDEKTGQFIIQTAPGSFSFLGAKFTKGPEGQFRYSENLTFPSGSSASSGSSATSSSTASSASSASTMAVSTDPNKVARQSAYDFLYEQFSQYGLGSLVEDIKGLVESNVSPSEFAIRLRQTPTYKKRFAANDSRIKAGLRALSEGEYIALEDQYQNIMRNYGLPKSYYEKDDIGRQAGFESFITGDVSPAELEDRIQLGMNRVKNAAPEVEQTLRQYYPGITQGDILAYTLDPEKALTEIQRKVQAAEIGAEARRAGLSQSVGYAEELQRYGVTKETAQQGFQAIAGFLPRASTLGDIYAKQGMGPYTQTTAEQEVFGLPSAAEAATKRRKLAELETAQFSGTSGATGGALGRERAGQF